MAIHENLPTPRLQPTWQQGLPPAPSTVPVEAIATPPAPAGKMQRLLGTVGLGGVKPGIRGWNRVKEAEASYDQPTFDFVAAHADDYIRYYGEEDRTTDAQVTLANDLLSKMSGDQVWPAVGFDQPRLTLSEKQGSFLKENDPTLAQVSQYNFRIVHDEKGYEWLLKRAERSRDAHKKVIDVERLQVAQEVADKEAMAYNVAAYMGYPVPETALTMYEGSPWVAYKYVDNALDSRVAEDQANGRPLVEVVSNPDAVTLRPVFNFVAGSFGDAAHQGIVDPITQKYYAQDLVVTGQQDVERALSESQLPRQLNAHDYKVLSEYVDKLRNLDPTTAAAVLNPKTPMKKQQLSEYAGAVSERAQTLVKLYDTGYFGVADTEKSSGLAYTAS